MKAGWVYDHDQSFVTLLDSLVARRLDSCVLTSQETYARYTAARKDWYLDQSAGHIKADEYGRSFPPPLHNLQHHPNSK